MTESLEAVFMVVGSAFMLLAALGLHRFPDVYSRLHAATKGGTLGVAAIYIAVAIHFGDLAVSAQTLLVILFVYMTAPVGAHMISRAAYLTGVPLWEKSVVDELHGRYDLNTQALVGHDGKHFSVFIREKNIVCNLEATEWGEVIEHLTGLLHQNDDCFDRQAALEACLQREQVSSTVIAPHLALPHARLEGLPKLLVATATSERGFDFPGKEPGHVKVVILILTPTSKPALYLQALSALTTDLGDPEVLQQLWECPAPRKAYALLSRKQVELSQYLVAGDVAIAEVPSLRENDNLLRVVDLFQSKQILDAPVLNADGDVCGAVSIEDMLRLCLPERLQWTSDLTPMLHFEPLAELLEKGKDRLVTDVMRQDYASIDADTPAVRLAQMFLTEGVRQIFVVDGRKLVGAVDLKALSASLF
ncbi:MAG: monovalent cation/H(+) antiporter subunit G [Planctomycetota bacterium]|jgi:multicomponent Na+:H+ antiporter subunit G